VLRIYKKMLLIIFFTFTLLSLLIYALSNIIFLQSFQDLENSYVSENVGRIQDAILREQSTVDGLVLDWGIWDETYSYIQGTNDDYIDINLPNESFINNELNVVLLINATGQLKYGKAFDLKRNEEIPLSQNILKELVAHSPFLLNFSGESITHSGINIFDDIPMIFSIGPILPNNEEGLPIGALFMGRYIDDEKIESLETTTHVSFQLYQYDAVGLPGTIQKARVVLSENQSVFVQPLNNVSIAGYTFLSDIYGAPCLIIEAEMPRSISLHGQETLNYFFIFMIVSDVVVAVVMILLLQKTILSRISNLSRNIRDIGVSGDSSARVIVSDNDELSLLAQDTNVMLEQLSASQEKLKESQQKLEKAYGEVIRIVQMKDDFINQLGHDLKTPLTPLINLLPMVREKEQDPKSKERLDVVIQSVHFMRDLVVKTIELAKLRSGKITFDIQDINLTSEVEDILTKNKILFESKNIIVENNIHGDIIVRADRLQLSEVLDNLLSNAVNFSSSQGIITIDAKKEENMVTISVKDNGIGLSQEQIECIFDEFYKGDESRHEAGSVGLGLSICKRIVEIHGGKIWVTSPGIGKGATFYFTLKKNNKK
jgi:signal transduction histidine kinase